MKNYKYDLYRVTGDTSVLSFVKTFLTNRSFRYIFYYRLRSNKGTCFFTHLLILLLSHFLHRKMSIEVPSSVKIGKGLLFIHPHGITINSKVIVGDNFTIMKGATIGNIKEGKNAGSPIIGNNVYVGLNSTVVGGITIGNNVLIAANTFVNFDVPDDSMVLGSPGVIHKGRTSEAYIYNSINFIK